MLPPKNIYLSHALHRWLKLQSTELDLTISGLLTKIVSEYAGKDLSVKKIKPSLQVRLTSFMEKCWGRATRSEVLRALHCTALELDTYLAVAAGDLVAVPPGEFDRGTVWLVAPSILAAHGGIDAWTDRDQKIRRSL